MCTIVLLRRPGHDWPLLLATNRDEMAARPWQPPGRHWPDQPGAIAGRDDSAAGTWLRMSRSSARRKHRSASREKYCLW